MKWFFFSFQSRFSNLLQASQRQPCLAPMSSVRNRPAPAYLLLSQHTQAISRSFGPFLFKKKTQASTCKQAQFETKGGKTTRVESTRTGIWRGNSLLASLLESCLALAIKVRSRRSTMSGRDYGRETDRSLLSLICSGVGNQDAIIGGRRWYFSTRGEAILCFLRLGFSPLCSQ
jgi:hypothetical protein